MPSESIDQLVGAFFQELSGSLFMMFLIVPFCNFLGDSATWSGWIHHFFSVIMIDIISGSAFLNPAVSIAFFVYGSLTFTGCVVRIIAQIIAAIVMFPLLVEICPKYIVIGGPSLKEGVDYIHGAIIEGVLTGALVLALFLIQNYSKSFQRIFVATLIRGIIYIAEPYTGAAINPMVGIGWAIFTNSFHNVEHLIIYWVAPCLGAIFAAVIYATILQPSDTTIKKNKMD